MTTAADHPTRALIHLDRLRHNVALLQGLAPGCPLWPAIKANAYGHGAPIIARALVAAGCDTLCVAHVGEAAALQDAGVQATFVILSAMLPGQAAEAVARGLEPAICTREVAAALSAAAVAAKTVATAHVKVDTGMARVGIAPDETADFLAYCDRLPGLRVRGLMSHFARADEADKAFSHDQIARFRALLAALAGRAVEVRHMANSAALLDLPAAHFDAVRPGIAIYGLRPSADIANAQVDALQPVLEWTTRVSFVKQVPAGTGVSYGHAHTTDAATLLATIPVGYGDGLSRLLSNRCEVLVCGRRCPQVGRITMDQTLIDVTALGGSVQAGDEVVLIGRQGNDEITADELAQRLGTINYEIVTAISARVPRVAVEGGNSVG